MVHARGSAASSATRLRPHRCRAAPDVAAYGAFSTRLPRPHQARPCGIPAHLRQPGRGHARAHAVIVEQHEAGAAHRDHSSVSCTSCPPGAETNPADGPRVVLLRRAHVERYSVRASASRASVGVARSSLATPRARPSALRRPARRHCVAGGRFGSGGPAALHLMPGQRPADRAVAQRETGLGMPALISDCAPMMLRVRPAQLTMMRVAGTGAMSRTRSASSPPGTLTPPRNVHGLVFLEAPGIEHHQIGLRSRAAPSPRRPRARACAGSFRPVRRTPCSAR